MELLSPEKMLHFCQLALERLLMGNYQAARPYLEAARAATDAPPPLLLRLQGVCAAGLQSFAEAIPLLEAALDGYRLAEDLAGEAAVAGDLASVLQRSGELGRAGVHSRWALDYAGTCYAAQHTWLLNIGASVAVFGGDFDQALAYLEQARILAVAPFGAWTALQTATTLDLAGRSAEAAAYLDQVQQTLPVADSVSVGLLSAANVWHAVLAGHYSKGYTICQQAMRQIAPADFPVIGTPLVAMLGVIARELGDLDRAEALFSEAFSVMQAHGDVAGQLGLGWHQVLCTQQRGKQQAALGQLSDVLNDMQTFGYATTLLWQPDRFAGLCTWAIECGVRHLHADWLLIHALAPWAGKAEPIRCASGVMTGDDAVCAALTTREHEILAQVAQGRSDREIAAELGLSTRTVHAHLQRIYGKLGVNNRSAALSKVFTLVDSASLN